MKALRKKIRELLDEGIYHQEDLFVLLYPTFPGHYSKLRQLIAEEKDR